MLTITYSVTFGFHGEESPQVCVPMNYTASDHIWVALVVNSGPEDNARTYERELEHGFHPWLCHAYTVCPQGKEAL